MFYHSKILGIKEDDKGTHLKILIPGEQVQDKILKVRSGKIINSEIRIDDNRTITAEQRKKVYATIRDIANYTGHMPEELKELMKYNYMIESGENYFSLSDCSITTARLFINYLIEFCFQWDISILDSGLDRTDDIGKYLWLCIKYHKCCICGGKAEIHHWDAVGMGRDRTSIDDSGHRKIALCREHHTEAHKIGRHTFGEKHHVYGIIFKD
jgi:putative HNHc nuclease